MLTGEDPRQLQQTAAGRGEGLADHSRPGTVVSTASLIRPEVVVRPDFARAADLGVTSQAIGDTLRIATTGDYDVALPKLNLAQRQVPINVRLNDERAPGPGHAGAPAGARHPRPGDAGQVASLELTAAPRVIDRYDRARNINFEIELSGAPLGQVTDAVQKLPSIRNLPAGVHIVPVGDAEMMGELFASFGLAMLTGVLCIYIVLVLLFKDFHAAAHHPGRAAAVDGWRLRGAV